MANIDRIVNVQIALGTSVVSQQSFNNLMLLVSGTWSGRVGIITSASALLAAPYSLASNSACYLAAEDCFSQNPTLTKLYIGRIDAADTTPAITMAAIVAENNDWYAFGDTSRTALKAVGYAAWTESNKKLFVTGVTGDDVLTTTLTDTAGLLFTAKYFRTIAMHINVATDYAEFAWAAKCLAVAPGAGTWANQTLAGISTAALSETQFSNIKFRNSNTFETFRNLAITQGGKVSGGEWIDIIRGRDWLEEEIKTGVFNLFVDKRLPFTDTGIRTIKQAIISALDLAQRRGFIAEDSLSVDGKTVIPAYKVVVPSINNVTVSDKAARTLNDVSFRATIAGAIHATTITGTLVYNDA